MPPLGKPFAKSVATWDHLNILRPAGIVNEESDSMLVHPIQYILRVFLPCWLAQHKMVAAFKLLVVQNGVGAFVYELLVRQL